MDMQSAGQSRLAAAYRGTPRTFLPAPFLLALVALAGCGKQAAPVGAIPVTNTDQAAKLRFYQGAVRPVLQANCYRCHAGMNRRGGLDMSTRARLLQGGKDGAVVLPGRPEDSLLVRAINPALAPADPIRMPPKGTRLTDAQVAAIRKWVADGAVMDR